MSLFEMEGMEVMGDGEQDPECQHYSVECEDVDCPCRCVDCAESEE